MPLDRRDYSRPGHVYFSPGKGIVASYNSMDIIAGQNHIYRNANKYCAGRLKVFQLESERKTVIYIASDKKLPAL